MKTALVTLTVFALAACHDGGTAAPSPRAVAIEISPAAVQLVAGDSLALGAVVRDAGGRALPDHPVSWRSSDPAVASVSAAGVVKAHRDGAAAITAASPDGPSRDAPVIVAAVRYELVHSAWPTPFDELRLFTVTLDSARSLEVLPKTVLPDRALTQPAASPDGRRIAFTVYDPVARRSYLYRVNSDGTGLTQLTFGGDESQAAWSPDGTRLAFVVRPRGGEGDIWVMDEGGGNPVNVTGAVNRLNQYSPAWVARANGDVRIAFGEGDGWFSNLWTMRPDGSDRRRVTTGPEWFDDEPSWSPDGTRLVFMREGPGTQGYDLWVVGADGDAARPLVQLPWGQGEPDWSPDGSHIAFTSSHAPDPADWFVIYTVASDGSQLTRRSWTPAMAARPAWRRK